MNKSIAIHQIETKTGDLEGNTKKVIDCIKKSNAEIDLFSELCLTGYNCGSLFKTDKFLQEAENALEEVIKVVNNKVVILGSIFQNGDDLYNSAFIITRNRIVDRYDKIHLANGGHHDDMKYFTPGTETKSYTINGLKFGVLICEDAWNEERELYRELKAKNVDIVFSLNCSYTTFGKTYQRTNVFKKKKSWIPTVYVNNVGMGDIGKNYFVYDGQSMVIDAYKDARYLPAFEEATKSFLFNPITKEFLHTEDLPRNYCEDKYDHVIGMATFAIRNAFALAGVKKAQVHMSGGIDSSVVGYLTVKAMGAENCVFISQPSKNNGAETKGNAQFESDALGVELIWDEIHEYIDIYKKNHPGASPIEIATFEATTRTSLGLSCAHRHKSAIVSCGNHTENALGFFTFHDIGSIGLLQPIGDLSKSEIFELANWINIKEKREIIPEKLYDGSMKPSAELEDNKDEDPYDYKIMSYVCEKLIRDNEYSTAKILYGIETKCDLYWDEYNFEERKAELVEYIEKARWLIKINVFKRAQSAPILILNDNFSFGFSNRETLISLWNPK